MSGADILRAAAQAIAENALEPAARMLRDHLEASPQDINALGMLAHVQARRGRPDRAEQTLRRAVVAAPEALGPRLDLAQLVGSIGRVADALALSRTAHSMFPNEPTVLRQLAAALNLMGEQTEAVEKYERLLAMTPDNASAWTGYATVLRILGRREEAIAAFQRSLAIAPEDGEAFWGLADLKTYPFSAAEVAAMTALVARHDLSPLGRSNILYALGKALEDAGDAEKAFAFYARGAGLRASADPDPMRVATYVDKAVRTFSADVFASRAGEGCADNDPIFIVGLPRSGSTLVEQILASHSQVEATMELPDLQVIARDMCDPELRARGGDYLDLIAGLELARLRELGERYLASTRPRRKTAQPFFVDKQPSNWAFAGLIRLILPNAKIIDVRRDAMACCWSCFKQNFVTGQSFTYDLGQLGRYYQNYARFMAHMDVAAPGAVHRVAYETLVMDPEPHIRALLTHCGLPFEEACLHPHETQRAVRTSSSEQVRRPISAKGLDDWRLFEAYLDPLKTALGAYAK